jgi:gliding motility-associated-like protein
MLVTIESPIDVEFVADTTKACGTGAFAFTNLIDPALITTSVWEFGDGGLAAEMNTDHIYNYPGFFDVSLTVNSFAGGCEYSATKEAYIIVYPLPTVGFYANPQPTTVPNTTISFDGFQSDNVIDWLWTFNAYNPLGFAIVEDPVFTFPYDVGGFYAVKLEVEDIFGCTNQVTREVEIRDLFNLFIPTSFTPNNDGTNDAFFIQGSDIDPERFEMQIFNRWGEIVFETTDLNDQWNGKVGVDGEYFSRNGTYSYRVEVHSISEESWRKEVFGYVMLIR